MKFKNHRFIVYRYQLLPIDRYFQGEIFGNIHNINELIEQKNIILNEIVQTKHQIKQGRNSIIAKKLAQSDTFHLFKYAVNRSITRETEKFTEEQLETWPSFIVCFWNDPNEQYLLIEERFDAFQYTDTVKKIIEISFNESLKRYQLKIHIESLFNITDFWQIIDNNRGKITSIDFELITPNMANISKVLPSDLNEFAKGTNTAITNFKIAADEDSSLSIDQRNSALVGLVKYSSEGGGNIKVKARGIKRKIETSQTKKSIEIDEIEINAETADDAIKIIKGML